MNSPPVAFDVFIAKHADKDQTTTTNDTNNTTNNGTVNDHHYSGSNNNNNGTVNGTVNDDRVLLQQLFHHLILPSLPLLPSAAAARPTHPTLAEARGHDGQPRGEGRLPDEGQGHFVHPPFA